MQGIQPGGCTKRGGDATIPVQGNRYLCGLLMMWVGWQCSADAVEWEK